MTTINGVTLGTGTNQFPPFAIGTGANVESPADWLADLVRQQGFQNGIADGTQFNTVWRQAMFVASMIAQFSADFSGATSNDDGDISELETNFLDALFAALQPYGVYILTDDGTGGANELVATSTPAPLAYSQVRLVVIKKTAATNTGPMQANLWGLGAVSFNDNTGTALSGGAVLMNAYYLMTYDGGAFRMLGGSAGAASGGGISANSGDAIQVYVPSSTVTFGLTSPGTVNWAGHGLTANTQVQFTTTGALATGLTAYTAYYVLSSGLTTNAFEVAASPGGTPIAFSGSPSGTNTCSATGAAIVNWRLNLGTHDTSVLSNDLWGRTRGTDNTARYMLTTEFLAWLETYFGTPIGGSHRNLLIANDASLGNSKINITADRLVLDGVSSGSVTISSYSASIATGTSGAGGVDTGSIAASTPYDVYAGYNATTLTCVAWLTREGNAPTVPSGVTNYNRISWTRTDAGGYLLKIRQTNREWQYVTQSAGATNTTSLPVVASGVIGSLSPVTYVSISLLGVAPIKSIAVNFIDGDNGVNDICAVAPNPHYGYAYFSTYPSAAYAASGSEGVPTRMNVVLETPSTVYGLLVNGEAWLCVSGGTINI